jgi:predicted acyltransferase
LNNKAYALSEQKSGRILSLDVFRGLTMALMVLVNSQGTRALYPILDHAPWNGCTLADLVFPAFLFIVGMTTILSLKKHCGSTSSEIYYSILKRTVLLFLFGLFLNGFPSHFDFGTLRVYGILQRIALCYFICALLYLNTSIKIQVLLFWGILVGYWYLITHIPLPGFSESQLTPAHNWVSYVDGLIFSPAHLLKKVDPEGLLSTLPAVATTLSGLITGSFLLSQLSKNKKCGFMMGAGILFLLVAWAWSYSLPLNKNLWTSSFVLWTSGISLCVFALCFYIIDMLGYNKWALPFKIFGMNALFIFIVHVLLLKIQALFNLPLKGGGYDNARVAISEYLFGGYSQENAGLFYSLVFLFLNFLIALFLYRRKLFFKI